MGYELCRGRPGRRGRDRNPGTRSVSASPIPDSIRIWPACSPDFSVFFQQIFQSNAIKILLYDSAPVLSTWGESGILRTCCRVACLFPGRPPAQNLPPSGAGSLLSCNLWDSGRAGSRLPSVHPFYQMIPGKRRKNALQIFQGNSLALGNIFHGNIIPFSHLCHGQASPAARIFLWSKQPYIPHLLLHSRFPVSVIFHCCFDGFLCQHRTVHLVGGSPSSACATALLVSVRASSTVFPLIISVAMELEAIAEPQPNVSNLTSLIVSSSTFR